MLLERDSGATAVIEEVASVLIGDDVLDTDSATNERWNYDLWSVTWYNMVCRIAL